MKIFFKKVNYFDLPQRMLEMSWNEKEKSYSVVSFRFSFKPFFANLLINLKVNK